MRPQGAHELGVDRERTVQLQLEVAVVATDGQRPQQHRRGALQPAKAPDRETDGEVHGLDPARRAQLHVLGGDLLGRHACGPQRDLVAEEVGQERRAPGDELRQTSRVRLRDLDARIDALVEVQQRRPPAQTRRLTAEPIALGLGDMGHPHARLREIEVAGGHGRRRSGHLLTDRDAAFCSPHDSHTMRGTRGPLASRQSFAVLGGAGPLGVNRSSPAVSR